MPEKISHNCGLCTAHTLHDVYSFIKSLQHRGREAAGIAAVGENRIDVIKWKGTVNRFDLVDLHKIFPSTNYHTYMAHVRYATKGRKDKILEDAHPHTIGGEINHRGDHIIISNCEAAIVHNGQVNNEYFKAINKDALKTGCDSEALLHLFKEEGEYSILKRIPGSYTLAIADKRRKEIVVLRDKTGMKPGVLGWKDGKFGIASEDIAFKRNGGSFTEDLDPGTIYYLAPDGSYNKIKVTNPQPAYCFFEYNYIADIDSILNGVSVKRIRDGLGKACAEEIHLNNIDWVSFLPRCPEAAAKAYASQKNIPFIYVFYKMRGERAFQGSVANERKNSINDNLHLLPGMEKQLRGTRGIIIDDSLIRGNNIKRERELLYEVAGVKEVYHLNYTPPIGIIGEDGVPRGCKSGGVDMPPNDDFIARDRTLEEINQKIRMPVRYLSLEGMLKSFERAGIPRENLCTYCIGGKDPLQGEE